MVSRSSSGQEVFVPEAKQPTEVIAPTPQPEEASPGVIYFTSRKEGSNGVGETTDFFKINPDGTNLSLIHSHYSSEAGWIWKFDVSPDGQKIAYFAYEGRDIYVINVDSSQVVNLTNTPDKQEYDPVWSPDGQRILYQQNYDSFKRLPDSNNISDIYVMNASGANPVNLTNYPRGYEAFAAVWSPDGQRLVFTSRKIEDFYGRYDTYIMNADGTNRVNLTASMAGDAHYPQWFPDGQRVSFEAEARTEEDKVEAGHYVVNINGTGRVRLPLPDHFDYDSFADLRWSPDGQRMAMCGFTFYQDIHGSGPVLCTLFTMNLDGTHLTQVSDDTLYVPSPYATWSPDGRQLAFSAAPLAGYVDRSTKTVLNYIEPVSNGLYVVNADGTQQTRLTDDNLKWINYIEWVTSP